MKKEFKIENFIGVYDNYISKDECDAAIKFFENQQKLKNTLSRQASEQSSSLQKKDEQFFASGNNTEIWVGTLKPLIFNFDLALKHYEKETSIKESCGGYVDFNYTVLKIQKTLPTEGYHLWHIEHSNFDVDALRRVLVFTIYLNDVEEGGETEFLHFSKRVKPKTGRIVIWPAGFPYVHRGNPPLSGGKYIITSWMLLPTLS